MPLIVMMLEDLLSIFFLDWFSKKTVTSRV